MIQREYTLAYSRTAIQIYTIPAIALQMTATFLAQHAHMSMA